MNRSGLGIGYVFNMVGKERMVFTAYEYYHYGNLRHPDEWFFQILEAFPEHIAHHDTQGFAGPFSPQDYRIDNFIPEPAGVADILRFYHALSVPLYTATDAAIPGVRVLDALNNFVRVYQSVEAAYYVFRYNYSDLRAGMAFGRTGVLYDYFYLFALRFDKRVHIGKLWYKGQ
jgi:hypothetical protein